MTRIVLTLTVDFDHIEDPDNEADVMKVAVQNRIFGEGMFSDNTIVDTWSTRTEIITPIR